VGGASSFIGFEVGRSANLFKRVLCKPSVMFSMSFFL